MIIRRIEMARRCKNTWRSCPAWCNSLPAIGKISKQKTPFCYNSFEDSRTIWTIVRVARRNTKWVCHHEAFLPHLHASPFHSCSRHIRSNNSYSWINWKPMFVSTSKFWFFVFSSRTSLAIRRISDVLSRRKASFQPSNTQQEHRLLQHPTWSTVIISTNSSCRCGEEKGLERAFLLFGS